MWISVFLSFASISDEIIWEENKNVFIKLLEVESSKYEHPNTISSDVSNAFLSQISIINSNENEDTLLFTSQQISLLSKYLPSALTQAKQNQVVVFSLIKKKSSLAGFLKRDVFTAGSIFIQQNTLTLKVGDVDRERQHGYESVYDPTNQGLVRYDFDFGLDSSSIASKRNTLGLLTDLDGFSTPQQNEVNIILSKLSELPQIIQQQATTKIETKNTGLTRQEVEQILNEREASSSTHKGEIDTKQQTRKSLQQTATESNKTTTKNLEERFKILQNLKDQGLISEQEYQVKRAELLAEI